MSPSGTKSVPPDPVAQLHQALLDRLRLGIALIDSHGRLFDLNRSAKRIVADLGKMGVEAWAHGIDGLPYHGGTLRTWLVGVLTADDAGPQERMLLIPRSGGRAPLSLLAARLPPAQAGLSSMAEPRAAGMLFISAPEAMTVETEKGLEVLFGISAMEAKIAAGLASGKRIGEIARERGVSINTVKIKTQLRRVLARTGARRQAELLRLVLTNVAAMCEQGNDAPIPESD